MTSGVWPLELGLDFLNHGSFGSCPSEVRDVQRAFQERMEREPVRFFVKELEGLLDEARAAVARLVVCNPDDLAFVPNATYAVGSVLASLVLSPGDEIVVTDHGYNACNNAARRWAERAGARVVVAEIPFPIAGARDALDAVLSAVGARTRLVLIDHVTSPTGLVLPITEIVRGAQARGARVLVDGAHGPGMLPLALDALGADYYTGNLHKWICAPKVAAFLHVRRDRQADLHPAVTSHGANSARTDRSRFLVEFDWTGTSDPSAILAVPAAIRFMESLLPGGLPAVMEANRSLALEARAILTEALGVAAPAPAEMIGALAAVPLPDAAHTAAPASALYAEPLQDALVARHRIQVPIVPWPASPRRLVRVSAQRYNSRAQYERLATALVAELARERDERPNG